MIDKFKICPICGQDMGITHITGKFLEMIEIFKAKMEFRRGQSSWLLKMQDSFSDELEKNTLICNPENFNSINHDGLIYLSVLYHELDIIDQELKGKKAELKTFPEYLINIENKELFAKKLKKEFSTGKGLKIRYMLEALIELDYLIISSRERKDIIDSLKKYFDRNIGTYSGIFPQTEDPRTGKGYSIILHRSDIDIAKKRIHSII